MNATIQLRSSGLVCSLLILFALAATIVGAEEKKEFTLHQVSMQVEEAMERYRDLSIAGGVTTKQRELIDTAYKQFKKSYDAAVEKAGGKEEAKKTPAPETVKGAAEQVIAHIAAIPNY